MITICTCTLHDVEMSEKKDMEKHPFLGFLIF